MVSERCEECGHRLWRDSRAQTSNSYLWWLELEEWYKKTQQSGREIISISTILSRATLHYIWNFWCLRQVLVVYLPTALNHCAAFPPLVPPVQETLRGKSHLLQWRCGQSVEDQFCSLKKVQTFFHCCKHHHALTIIFLLHFIPMWRNWITLQKLTTSPLLRYCLRKKRKIWCRI